MNKRIAVITFTVILVLCSYSFCFASSLGAIQEIETMSLRSVNVSNERISASDTNGFKSVMLSLIGDYETTITDYVYQNQQGYTQHSINVEQDWSWIMSCVLFTVVVFCTFLSVAKILSRF